MFLAARRSYYFYFVCRLLEIATSGSRTKDGPLNQNRNSSKKSKALFLECSKIRGFVTSGQKEICLITKNKRKPKYRTSHRTTMMINSQCILDLNTKGITLLKEGNQQEALNTFQLALSNLIAAVQIMKNIGIEATQENDKPIKTGSDVIPPFSMELTLHPSTQDKMLEQAHTMFHQALVLPSDGELKFEQCDMIYGCILYHIGLVYHGYGMEQTDELALAKALETYKLSLHVVINDMSTRPLLNQDINHWLLYAIFNNMANLYSYARVPEMIDYCTQNLRMVLAYSNTELITQNDMLFLVLNLDVATGPGVISASAA